MKLAELSEARLSKAIAEKRWPFLTYIQGQLYYRADADNVWTPFNCTIPNDIFPIFSDLVDYIVVELFLKHKEHKPQAGVLVLNDLKDALKSTRAMSELILWYYVGDEYDE